MFGCCEENIIKIEELKKENENLLEFTEKHKNLSTKLLRENNELRSEVKELEKESELKYKDDYFEQLNKNVKLNNTNKKLKFNLLILYMPILTNLLFAIKAFF